MAKSDWNAAAEELLALERERLGPPPSAEEVRAYLNGELDDAEAERVRDLLVCYPELAAAIAGPAVEATQPESLSAEELDQNWLALRTRIAKRRRETAWPRSWPLARLTPMAAVLAIGVATVGLLQWRWHDERDRLTRQISEPRAHGIRHTLDAIGTRGPSGPRPYPLPADEENFLLAPALVNHPDFPDYRIDIVDITVNPPRTIWSKGGFRRHPRGGTLELSVPRAFLDSGIYRLDIYGVGGAQPRFVASYLVEAP